jgi:hypothetical protein
MSHRPAEGVAQELVILRQRPEWPSAVSKLRDLAAAGGEGARAAASRYSQVYAGRRGAMVVDVVASRQRNYERRVLPLVDRWAASVPEPTLAALSATPPEAKNFGLQASEPKTMRTVAENLLALSTDLDVSEDEACRVWADSVQGLEHAHRLDPIVGGVSGIGPALFAYMRMRCGANALKPDQRVAAALSDLGFSVPGDGHSTIVIARAAAAEIGFDLLTLDQLLWGRTA